MHHREWIYFISQWFPWLINDTIGRRGDPTPEKPHKQGPEVLKLRWLKRAESRHGP